MINKESLISDLKGLGIKEGDLIHIKVSLKSIGKIEGGVNTLIDAIMNVLGSTGTLICDSFIESQLEILRFFKKKISEPDTPSYAGAFVNAAIKYPGSYRSKHPIQAFTAIGARAKELTERFTKDSLPYEFLEWISMEGGKNLRIGPANKIVGVGTTHIAICRLGLWQKQVVKGIYFKDDEGHLKWFRQYWADGCALGFKGLMPYYYDGNAIIKEGKVGNTDALLSDMKKTLDIELKLFKKDNTAFMCGKKDCVYCSFSWEKSPYSFTTCLVENLKKKQYKKAIHALAVFIFGKKLK